MPSDKIKMKMAGRDKILLGLYLGVFLLGFYTNMKINQHEALVEDLRQINKDTWTI